MVLFVCWLIFGEPHAGVACSFSVEATERVFRRGQPAGAASEGCNSFSEMTARQTSFFPSAGRNRVEEERIIVSHFSAPRRCSTVCIGLTAHMSVDFIDERA